MFDPKMHQRAVEQLRLESDLRQAMERWANWRSNTSRRVDWDSGKILGTEALLRWHHPTRGDGPAERIASRWPRRPG